MARTYRHGGRLVGPAESRCILDDINSVDDLVAWIDATLEKLNSADTFSYASDYWPQVWDEAVGYAYALGLPDAVDSFEGPLRVPTSVCVRDGKYDYDTPAKAMRDQLWKKLRGLQDRITGKVERQPLTDTWLTVGDAAKASGCPAYTITRAANHNELVTNGETEHARRVSGASLAEWQRNRAMQPERIETDAAVRRKLDKASRER